MSSGIINLIVALLILSLFESSSAAANSRSFFSSLELACIPDGNQAAMIRLQDNRKIATFTSVPICLDSRDASRGGAVCVYFLNSMPVGPEGWNETGWRAMSVRSQMGLGRKVFASREQCLEATRAAAGGLVCTNTGLGAKSTSITTNRWCGASSQLAYCLQASQAARNFTVCSFPSEGTGIEDGWVRTVVTSDCEYQGPKRSLADCNLTIP